MCIKSYFGVLECRFAYKLNYHLNMTTILSLAPRIINYYGICMASRPTNFGLRTRLTGSWIAPLLELLQYLHP